MRTLLQIIEDVDHDAHIEALVEQFKKAFGKSPEVVDNRSQVGLANEVIIWIQKK